MNARWSIRGILVVGLVSGCAGMERTTERTDRESEFERVRGEELKPTQLAAEKHLNTVNATLRAAIDNSKALWDIAGDDASYDMDHAKLLSGNIVNAINTASTHMSHLMDLATGPFRDTAPKVQQTITQLGDASSSAQRLHQSVGTLDRASIRSATADLYRTVDRSWSSFKEVSQAFGIRTELPTPR